MDSSFFSKKKDKRIDDANKSIIYETVYSAGGNTVAVAGQPPS